VSPPGNKCRFFAGQIAPGLAAIILFAPERVLIHLGQPTIGAPNAQRTSEKVSTLKKVP